MNKGRTLSYWEDSLSEDDEAMALYVRNRVDDQWLLVGIYEKGHLNDILRTTYASWPKGTIYFHQLP